MVFSIPVKFMGFFDHNGTSDDNNNDSDNSIY